MSKLRRRVLHDARRRVLEIGAGTGASFAHYPADAEVVSTEPDKYMLEKARRKLQGLGLTNISLVMATADHLPFAPVSFDDAVSTLVRCTAADVRGSLTEVQRVLKPDGGFHFIEHVRNDESGFWAVYRTRLPPPGDGAAPAVISIGGPVRRFRRRAFR